MEMENFEVLNGFPKVQCCSSLQGAKPSEIPQEKKYLKMDNFSFRIKDKLESILKDL